MTELRTYVGCVPCREAGLMVGWWFPALTAPENTAEFECLTGHVMADHPKGTTLRVFDHDGFGDLLHGEFQVEHVKSLARKIMEEM